MERKIIAKPLLYIIQPEFTTVNTNMQDRFIWRKQLELKEVPKTDSNEMQTIIPEKIIEDKDQLEEQRPLKKPVKRETELQQSETKDRILEEPELQPGNGLIEEIPTQEEQSAHPVNQSLVEKFMKQFEEANRNQVDLPVLSSEQPTTNPLEAGDEETREIWQTVTRLSRYPIFLKKPLAEAVVGGQKMIFEVHRKRNRELLVKMDEKYKTITIDDITSIKVLD
ncbi:hypothetical protein A8F94_16120 [Bacillus sp. FJAT-27225]|uniref:hypothetical protein n=1 Tax=Bacillus sp. FJAT-27225 TaxID=1743144 RepID=UPI00080C22A3|nr:hypothetical protein [Bacillus sp. FJAT-27225]OCA84241.1 hypothetical protein A8F94_16120 [Bacillus sp. FJAT-27225]